MGQRILVNGLLRSLKSLFAPYQCRWTGCHVSNLEAIHVMDGKAGHLLLNPVCLTELQNILYCVETVCIKIQIPCNGKHFHWGSRWTASSFVSMSPICKSVLYLNCFSLSLTSKDNHMEEHPYYITEYLALAWELSYKKLNALLHICGLLKDSFATHILWKGKEKRDAREMMWHGYSVR